MDRIYNDAKDKNVAKVIVFVNDKKAYVDAAHKVQFKTPELKDAFMKGCVLKTDDDTYAIPTNYIEDSKGGIVSAVMAAATGDTVAVARVAAHGADIPDVPESSYLKFLSPEPFSIAALKKWDGVIEYQNGNEWTPWDGTELNSVTVKDTNMVHLRGTGNSKITGSAGPHGNWFLTGKNISCSGNIENLLDWKTVENGEHPKMAYGCYEEMFDRCKNLIAPPALSATTLVNNCYLYMFEGCTNLKTAPELPATTLARSCYFGMFNRCTNLTTPPALPATTLVNSCYYFMFYNCANLLVTPRLPATTLANYCYGYMFEGCTNLTTAPELPATTLATGCYCMMFETCKNLTTAPELPATILAESCYYQMFKDCTNLTTLPTLLATTLAKECYYQMFKDCTNLTILPTLLATILADNCYDGMFYGCTKIKLSATVSGTYTKEYRIPKTGTGVNATDALTDMFANTGGTFTGTPAINTVYYLDESNTIV